MHQFMQQLLQTISTVKSMPKIRKLVCIYWYRDIHTVCVDRYMHEQAYMTNKEILKKISPSELNTYFG